MMTNLELFERPSALRHSRAWLPSVAAPAHAPVVGRPAVTDTAPPTVRLLTCQRSAVINAELAQVGRTQGVSTNGYGAQGTGMVMTLEAVNAFGIKASGVPPRGRPV